MNYFILIIILFAGIWIGSRLTKKKSGGGADGLEKAREAVQERKDKAKQQMMEMLEEKGKIANDDVEELLGVSDATATNYLKELEEEGKIIQKGETGRGVYYIKK